MGRDITRSALVERLNSLKVFLSFNLSHPFDYPNGNHCVGVKTGA